MELRLREPRGQAVAFFGDACHPAAMNKSGALLSLFLVIGCGRSSLDLSAAPTVCPLPYPVPACPVPTVCPPPEPPTMVAGPRAVYAWSFYSGAAPPWTFSGFNAPDWTAAFSGGDLDLPDLEAGDELVVAAQLFVEVDGGAGGVRLSIDAPGEAPLTIAELAIPETSYGWRLVTLSGTWQVVSGAPAHLVLEARADDGATLYIQGPAHLAAVVQRP